METEITEAGLISFLVWQITSGNPLVHLHDNTLLPVLVLVFELHNNIQDCCKLAHPTFVLTEHPVHDGQALQSKD